MFKKILVVALVLILMPILFVEAYGWTTQTCKSGGCDCFGTSEYGKCVVEGGCSKCKEPVCRFSTAGNYCYLVDLKECEEVYEVYPNCPDSCKSILEQFVSQCRNDTQGKGEYYNLPISDCCNKKEETKPAPEMETVTYTGTTVNLEGNFIPDIKVVINCSLVQLPVDKRIWQSDDVGEFTITFQAEKTKPVFCNLAVGNTQTQLITKLTGVKPGDLGEIRVGTVIEYESDMRKSVQKFLRDSGVSEADAVAYTSYVVFDYKSGGTSFEPTTESWATGKLYGDTYKINLVPEAYLDQRENVFHEMMHAIAQKMFPDLAPSAGPHDVFTQTVNTGAFDEARAHLFAYLMLKQTGAYDASEDKFQDGSALIELNKNKIDLKNGGGEAVEGSVTTFLKDYYVNINPDIAWKDFIKTVSGCKDTMGHSCQTISEFLKQKGFVGNGVKQNAEKLGIKVDLNDTCIIKEGSSYKLMGSDNIQLDVGDIGCGSKNIRVNDIQIQHEKTQYLVSKKGDNLSVSVLDGAVRLTNMTNNETVDVSVGEKITYNSSATKFSPTETIKIENVDKFWEENNEKSTFSFKSLIPIFATVFVVGGIGVILFARKRIKKAA